jgi:8-oxo-dGTP pyrophosphatase MutT (NUDIX family)
MEGAPKILAHQVRVFVFRFDPEHVEYLLLRRRPRSEHTLGPVRGRVDVSEHLQDAVLREVRAETGIVRPAHLIDLEHTSTFVVGDQGLVQWEFGYQVPGTPPGWSPGPEIAETLWTPFEGAFRTLEQPDDRSALVRLQMYLQAG